MVGRRVAIALTVAVVLLMAAFLAALAHQFAMRDETAIQAIGSATIVRVLGPDDFASGDFDPDFAVASDGTVVVERDAMLSAVTGGTFGPTITPLEVHAPDRITSFALDSNDTMLTIAGRYFGKLDADGTATSSIPLPYDNAQLAPSAGYGAVFLFGGTPGDHRLYRFVENGTLQILLQSNDPIVAAADNPYGVYAATANAILKIEAGKPRVLLVVPPDIGAIVSLAVSLDGQLFFSTVTRVYALTAEGAVSIVNDAGGTLRLRAGRLYVMSRERRMLFSLSPASRALFTQQP